MDDALEAITMEDLYDDQRELAEVIGLQSFKELIYTTEVVKYISQRWINLKK